MYNTDNFVLRLCTILITKYIYKEYIYSVYHGVNRYLKCTQYTITELHGVNVLGKNYKQEI